MRPRSDSFDAAARNAHTVYAKATVLTPDGEALDLPIGEGSSVTLDGTAATRGALSLTVPADADWVPVDSSSPLAPFGSEITIVRGMTTPDGVTEAVQIGVFRIDEVRVADSEGGFDIEVSGLDRSSRVIDAVFEAAGGAAAGTSALGAAQLFVQVAYPDATFDFIASDTTLPAIAWEIGDDRWDYAQGCAEAAGCNLYFDGDGVCVAKPLPVTDTADLELVEGEGGVLVSADVQWGRENACNRVTVSGENGSDDPVWGEAIDDDPDSPTFYDGPFGKATYEWSSSYVTTDAQAADVARNILEMRRGVGRQVSFSALANPALEPFDVVKITRADLGIDELHIIDTLQIPLDASGVMTGTTRVARVL